MYKFWVMKRVIIPIKTIKFNNNGDQSLTPSSFNHSCIHQINE